MSIEDGSVGWTRALHVRDLGSMPGNGNRAKVSPEHFMYNTPLLPKPNLMNEEKLFPAQRGVAKKQKLSLSQPRVPDTDHTVSEMGPWALVTTCIDVLSPLNISGLSKICFFPFLAVLGIATRSPLPFIQAPLLNHPNPNPRLSDTSWKTAATGTGPTFLSHMTPDTFLVNRHSHLPWH